MRRERNDIQGAGKEDQCLLACGCDLVFVGFNFLGILGMEVTRDEILRAIQNSPFAFHDTPGRSGIFPQGFFGKKTQQKPTVVAFGRSCICPQRFSGEKARQKTKE